MKFKYEDRYYTEQDFFPYDLYRKDRQYQLIKALEEQPQKFLKMIFDSVWNSEGRVCPYTKDQFSASVKKMKTEGYPEYSILTVYLPKPEAIGLCSKILICHCDGDKYHRYYTVEKSFGFNKFMLCGVDEKKNHSNYGDAPTDESMLLKRVEGLYIPFLKKDMLDSIVPAYRKTALEITELLTGCKLITDCDKTGENIIEQTAVFLLAIITIAYRDSLKLVKDIIDELTDIIENSINEEEFAREIDLYTDVYTKIRDPKNYWLPVPIAWSKTDAPLKRLMMVYGDLLVNPNCAIAYSTDQRPIFPEKDLKEFQRSFLEQVAAKIDEFVKTVGNVRTWRSQQKEFVSSSSQGSSDVPDQIRKYKALMDDGIITAEEFNQKKKELLNL